MQPRRTIFWLLAALVLFAVIVFLQKHGRKPAPGQGRVLPEFVATNTLALQVRPPGPQQLEIRAHRTNDSWVLDDPVSYPAQSGKIESLLAGLQQLMPAAYITASEIISRPEADEEYGFTSNQAASIILQQGTVKFHLLVGNRTAPGDQVFLQVVGREGVYVIDAELLKLIPKSANEWRDTALVPGKAFAFDRIGLTNAPRGLAGASSYGCELRWNEHRKVWRMVYPIDARADNNRIESSLEKLKSLQVQQFVSDTPKADLETFGLHAPELELELGRGTNRAVLLQFGRTVTNNPAQVYARRFGDPTIMAVDKSMVMPWRGSVNDFRDPHLVSLPEQVDAIEVCAEDTFSIARDTNQAWRISPGNSLGDPALVRDLISGLSGIEILEFKDAVTAPDLKEYGLAAPARRFILKNRGAGSGAEATNVVVELDFGWSTNHPGRVFARRLDETSVYSVNTNQVARLPSASWQLRDRRLWHMTMDDIVAVTTTAQGQARRILRRGDHDWTLAAGSSGVINDLAVEETVRGLAQATVSGWVACGETNLARFGIVDGNLHVSMELKSGDKAAIAFAGEAASHFPYATTVLEGRNWVFEFPWALYRDVVSYLTPPAKAP